MIAKEREVAKKVKMEEFQNKIKQNAQKIEKENKESRYQSQIQKVFKAFHMQMNKNPLKNIKDQRKNKVSEREQRIRRKKCEYFQEKAFGGGRKD